MLLESRALVIALGSTVLKYSCQLCDWCGVQWDVDQFEPGWIIKMHVSYTTSPRIIFVIICS